MKQIMRAISRYCTAAAIAAGCMTQAANAAVVFEQPFSNPLVVNAAISSQLSIFPGPGSTTADDFSLGSAAAIGEIHWWGQRFSGGNAFNFTFYADSAGQPGAVLLTTTGSLTSAPDTNNPIATFYSTLLNTPFSAAAGTPYWLSVFNAAPDATWGWVASDSSVVIQNGRHRQNDLPDWEPLDGLDLGFRLLDTPVTPVPEPASYALFAMGVALLSFRRRFLGVKRA